MTELILRKYPYLIIISFMVGQLLAQITLLTKGIEYISTTMTIDDTYYYLETAWNHHLLGYPTFDKINETNGFHFLWYLIILGISNIIPAKHMLLPGVIAFCSLLTALPYIFFINLGLKLKSFVFPLLLASLWFFCNISLNTINGMENSLHIFISFWILYEIFSFFYTLNSNEQVNLIRLTFILILNAYSRLDSGLFSAVVFLLCLTAIARHRGGIKRLLKEYNQQLLFSILAIVISIIILLSSYWYWGQTFIPISGIIKNSGINFFHEYPTISKAVKVYNYGLPIIPFLFYIAPALTSVILFFTFKKRNQTQLGITIFFKVHLVFFLGAIFYSAFMWLSPTTTAFGMWYFSPVNVYWIFVLSICLYLFISFLFQKHFSLGSGALVSVFLLSIIIGGRNYIIEMSSAPTQSLYHVRYNVALWIADNIPDDVFASWNSGQLGYFSNHRVINLDGLIN